jgi:hypothetical protein
MLSKAKNPARQHNQVFHSDRYWWEFIFHAPFGEGQSNEQSEKKAFNALINKRDKSPLLNHFGKEKKSK